LRIALVKSAARARMPDLVGRAAVVHLVDLEAALVDETGDHVAPLFPPQHDQQARAFGRIASRPSTSSSTMSS
jgi:hypothetical protein